MQILGIDFGGSGIKGAPVDLESGNLLAERYRIPTPDPSRPKAVAEVVARIAQHFNWTGSIGCGYPGVVRHGVTLTADNVDKRWLGTNAAKLLSKASGCPVKVVNDADAAGLAEMKLGAGQNRMGVVMIVTVGTGIGTALFTDGHLCPNTELGHIEIKGKDAELLASDRIRKSLKLSWRSWAENFDLYLHTLEHLFSPDLFILGGGISKKTDLFLRYLSVQAEVVPAVLRNDAGIIGAALAFEL